MFEAQIETTNELVEQLAGQGDMPLYARTPHSTYHFIVTDTEVVSHEGEQVRVLVLKEVQW